MRSLVRSQDGPPWKALASTSLLAAERKLKDQFSRCGSTRTPPNEHRLWRRYTLGQNVRRGRHSDGVVSRGCERVFTNTLDMNDASMSAGCVYGSARNILRLEAAALLAALLVAY